MRTAEVQALVGRVAAVDAGCGDWGPLKAGIADVRVLKSWLEGREVAFAQALAKVSSFPEKSLAEAANTSVRDGGRLLQRAETAAAVPEFARSLDEGRISGDHLDVLTRTLRGLQPVVRDQLVGDGERLVIVAESSTPDEFARSVREAARRLEADGDGLERLARQRAAVRLAAWVDKQTGMGHWFVTFDPATFAGVGGSSRRPSRDDVP